MTNQTATPRYPKYAGVKRYAVHHPSYPTFTVYAPSPVAAIIAAADHWGENWQHERFYNACMPERVGA